MSFSRKKFILFLGLPKTAKPRPKPKSPTHEIRLKKFKAKRQEKYDRINEIKRLNQMRNDE